MGERTVFIVAAALIAGAAGGYFLPPLFESDTPDRIAPSATEERAAMEHEGMAPEADSALSVSNGMEMEDHAVEAQGSDAERQPLFYRHPMNPEITSPVPSKDEMGMDYIPVYADVVQGDEPAGTVTIDPVTVQNIGVRTAVAEQRALSRTIQTRGRIDFDEERLTRLHPKTEGWIEKLHVNQTGQAVERGTIMLSIYSPQLVSSQQEYLLALKNRDILKDSPYADVRQGAEDLVAVSRERLELLDVPEHQLRELEESGEIKKNLHIHSPFLGVVLAIGAREGQYVTPMTELYQIADLSRVWVYVDVYEQELSWVKVGDEAEMRVTSLPGRSFKGRISYIYPYLERETRTVKARLEFDNADLALKPEMFANVTLFPEQHLDAVVIPVEAVIRSGTGERVFVVRGPGKFEPRAVTLGVVADGLVQIIEGVAPGEEVVTSAQFLIDSESKLREAAAKMRDLLGSHTPEHEETEEEMPMPVPEGEAPPTDGP